MGDDALEERARELAGEISAAEANLAAVLAEVERRGLHSDWECRDVVRFAGWHLQYAPGRARGLVEVGRAMETLPVVAEAVADGTLSFDKAKSIVRVAAPETERALVDMALHATTAQTQRICGKWGKVAQRENAEPNAETPSRQLPELLVVTDDDGIELRIRFDHVHGQLVLASIDAEAKAIRNERKASAAVDPTRVNDPNGVPACDEDRTVDKLTVAEWRALGLLRLAERSASEQPEGLQASGFDTTVVVHVGIDTLYGPDLPDPELADPELADPELADPELADPELADPAGSTVDDRSEQHRQRDEMAELEPAGVKLRRDIARWLACDTGLLTVIEDRDGNPLHLGKRKSSVPPAIRKAVMSRYRTCAWPGCTATAVQMHHTHHRADGGHDDVESIVPECLEHHQLIHTHGIWITIDTNGTVHHWRPDGTEIHANPAPDHGTVNALDAPQRLTHRRLALGADPTETARQPRWHGDPFHLGDCIEAIQARRDHALQRTHPTRNGPPPTSTDELRLATGEQGATPRPPDRCTVGAVRVGAAHGNRDCAPEHRSGKRVRFVEQPDGGRVDGGSSGGGSGAGERCAG